MAAVDQEPASSPTRGSELEAELLRELKAKRRTRLVAAWSIRLAFLVLFLGTWHVLSATGTVPAFFIGDPIGVVTTLLDIVQTANLWFNVEQTFVASLLSLLIGSFIGILAGVVLSRSPTLAQAMNPFIALFNGLPRPALAPLFILWFGLGISAKVMVGITIVFFILLVNTMAGLSSIDPDIALLSRSLGASKLQRFAHVEVPWALPSIVAGLRLAAVYSVLGVVVSEMVASYYGIGQMLVQATNGFEINLSFALLAILALMAMALDLGVSLIQKSLERRGAEAVK
jgi:NitT/TauT family transport system permease protein